MKCVVNDQVVLSRPPKGPLVRYIAAFSDWTREQGYTLGSLRYRARLAASFSEWLSKNSVRLHDVRASHCAKYLQYRARRRRVRKADVPTLRHLLDFLRHLDVVTGDRVRRQRLSPVEQCVQAFERYLCEDRALAKATVINHRGDVRLDLAMAVPRVANWSMPAIPRAIAPDQVRRLLAQIDRSTAMGRRDYAVLLLLARLVDAPTSGAHQFRHGLASEMLRHGASLSEIGQLLGHRSPETTKIYTAVDLDALRTLTPPWPGGVR